LVELLDNTTRYIPVGIIIGIILMTEISTYIDETGSNKAQTIDSYSYTQVYTSTNIELLGNLLYSSYAINLIIAGFILLIAMIGAIILTLGHEQDVKRQDILTQDNTYFLLSFISTIMLLTHFNFQQNTKYFE